ncbi:MAG: hypothetical protein WA653_15950, partial [Candidatus Sulfotelmatobacter sp.]
YLKAAEDIEAQARVLIQQAQDLRQRAALQDASYPSQSGPVKIGDWTGVKPAGAMKQYMGQFPVGHRIHVKEIVKDLRKGGCVIEGELRPNETYQIAAERKISRLLPKMTMCSPATTRVHGRFGKLSNPAAKQELGPLSTPVSRLQPRGSASL